MEQPNITGSTGLLRTSLAGSGAPGTFRISFLMDWFSSSGFLCRPDDKTPEGKPITVTQFEAFEPGVAGSLTPVQYDEFVRDTVNFLHYVGDPSQVERQSLGIWVGLFLLMFTAIAWMLKAEYWKAVH